MFGCARLVNICTSLIFLLHACSATFIFFITTNLCCWGQRAWKTWPYAPSPSCLPSLSSLRSWQSLACLIYTSESSDLLDCCLTFLLCSHLIESWSFVILFGFVFSPRSDFIYSSFNAYKILLCLLGRLASVARFKCRKIILGASTANTYLAEGIRGKFSMLSSGFLISGFDLCFEIYWFLEIPTFIGNCKRVRDVEMRRTIGDF